MTTFLSLLLLGYLGIAVELWRGDYCSIAKEWHREPWSFRDAFRWPIKIFHKE